MAFRLEDFKKTMRKSAEGSGAPASVYPHQIKDKKAIARLEVAIRTFDTLVGKRRGEMDAQTLIDFFGDPRLARGIVACLGQYYVYRTPRFADVVGSEAAQRLAAAGLDTPIRLRAHTYTAINEQCGGYLPEARRTVLLNDLAQPFGLNGFQWESLLYLDSEDNQILNRTGAIPVPADLVSLYNFHALDTVLRRSSKIVLNGWTLTANQASDIRAFARTWGVRAVVSSSALGEATLTLTDLDMASLLPRRAGRLSRCFLYFSQAFGDRHMTGYAEGQLGTRRCRLVFNADLLKALGVPLRRSEPSGISLPRRAEAITLLHKDLLKQRTQNQGQGLNGWRIKRQPEPIVTAGGILQPDFLWTRGEQRVAVMLGAEVGPSDWGMSVISVRLGRKPIIACDLLGKVEDASQDLFALPAPVMIDVPSDVRSLCDRAAAQGLVRTSDAQRTLHLLDESPLIEWMRRLDDPRVRYLPGIGLCAQELVTAITAADQITNR